MIEALPPMAVAGLWSAFYGWNCYQLRGEAAALDRYLNHDPVNFRALPGRRLRSSNDSSLMVDDDYRMARYGRDGTVVINQDRSFSWRCSRVRRKLKRRAKKLKIPVAPASFQAVSGSQVLYRDIKLVERRGRECVFSVGASDKTHYLSGYDKQEFPPLYFLSRLPTTVETVPEARQALKPQSVVMAEKDRKVYRQGDMFAIPTDLTSKEIKELGGKYERRMRSGFPFRWTMHDTKLLYQTAHTATEIVTLPDGTQLARGKLHHDPQLLDSRRRKDHRARRLRYGKWHIIVKNAVPVVNRRRPLPQVPVRSIPTRRHEDIEHLLIRTRFTLDEAEREERQLRFFEERRRREIQEMAALMRMPPSFVEEHYPALRNLPDHRWPL